MVLAGALAACGDNVPVYAEPTTIEVAAFPARGRTAIDVLLQIDDSPNTAHFQLHLGEQISALLDPLTAAVGRAPDLHLGVITSDLGTTGSLDPAQPGPPLGQLGNGGCAGAGKDGALQTSGAPVTDRFVIDVDDGQGGRTRNYTGALLDVLSIITRVGAGGCGFEQPLAATRRALANPVNAGFLRPDTGLLVVMIADEDDCSVRDAALLAADPALGPLQSFRCTAQGVVCDQPLDELGPKTGCHARADSPYVEDPAVLVGEMEAVVPAARLAVGVLSGPPAPFEIEARNPPGGGNPVHALAHSCGWSEQFGLVVAEPAVRLWDLAAQRGAHGMSTQLCQQDLAAPLAAIARLGQQLLGVACIDTSALRDASTEPGIQPTCTVTSEVAGEAQPVPACPAAAPCFELVSDPAVCATTPDHARLVIRGDLPATALVRARCEAP